MKAVITVLGKDTVGILAAVSDLCAKNNINVTDVTQTVLDNLFAMLMMVDMSDSEIGLSDFSKAMKSMGEKMGLAVYVVHEDVFNSMHHI